MTNFTVDQFREIVKKSKELLILIDNELLDFEPVTEFAELVTLGSALGDSLERFINAADSFPLKHFDLFNSLDYAYKLDDVCPACGISAGCICGPWGNS